MAKNPDNFQNDKPIPCGCAMDEGQRQPQHDFATDGNELSQQLTAKPRYLRDAIKTLQRENGIRKLFRTAV